jgi:hypothetical protein
MNRDRTRAVRSTAPCSDQHLALRGQKPSKVFSGNRMRHASHMLRNLKRYDIFCVYIPDGNCAPDNGIARVHYRAVVSTATWCSRGETATKAR